MPRSSNFAEGLLYLCTRELKISPKGIRAWMEIYLPSSPKYKFCDADRIAVVREILDSPEYSEPVEDQLRTANEQIESQKATIRRVTTLNAQLHDIAEQLRLQGGPDA